MKTTFKRLLCLFAAVLAFGVIYASALSVDSWATQEHINKMIRLIDNQNFDNTLGVTHVKEKVNFFLYDSAYAAAKGDKKFPYPNKGAFSASVQDGNTKVSVRSSKGCLLYARYVNTVVNGKDASTYRFLEQLPGEVTADGVKNFLLTYAQAGEHLRIDATHSVAFISGDDTGFYFFQYPNDGLPFIRMGYVTYADFASEYGSVPPYTGEGDTIDNIYSIWLYDSNGNTNSPYTAPSADTASGTATACPHKKYDSQGRCKACGKSFPHKLVEITPTEYTLLKKVPKRIGPYAVKKHQGHVGMGERVTAVAYTYNSYGNLWYEVKYTKKDKLSSREYTFWVYSENMVRLNEVTFTMKDPTNVGENSLQLNAVCAYTLQRPDRIVMRMGTSKSNMKKYTVDAITFSKNPFDLWYNIKDLKKDTIYYYQLIAEFDDLPYECLYEKSMFKSPIETFMIASSKDQVPAKPDTEIGDKVTDALLDALSPITWEVKPHERKTQTSARMQAVCTYVGTRPKYVALYLGLSNDPSSMWQYGYDEINFTKNPFDVWYDVSGMAENKTYYYQFRAEVDGKIYSSEVKNITTMDTSVGDAAMDALVDALSPVFTVKPLTRYSQTSVRLQASCSYTGTRPTYVALYLGLSNDPNSMWQYGYDAITFSKNPFDVWYDVSGMAENKTYYYRFRTEVDGVVYSSPIHTVTTMKTSGVMDDLLGALQ